MGRAEAFDGKLLDAMENYLKVSVECDGSTWDDQRVVEVAPLTVTLEYSYKDSGGLFCSHNTIFKDSIVAVSVLRLVAN